MNERAAGTSAVLHLLAGDGRRAVDDCRESCAAGDTVVLMADGVFWPAHDAGMLTAFPCPVMVLGADAEARGVPEKALEAHQRIDDAGLVGLIASHAHCLTWR